MLYHYRAKNQFGAAILGDIDAASENDARQRLRSRSLFLTSLTPTRKAAAAVPARRWAFRGRVKRSELVTMMSQLTLMCQSGVDVAEALRNLSQHTPPGKLKDVLTKAYEDVSAGESLSESLSRHSDVFDAAFVAGIAAGERSGDMVQVLQRLTVLVRNEARLVASLWALLTYPMLLCGVMTVVMAVIVFYVLPQFATVFEGLGHTPPPLTRCLLAVGAFAKGHWLSILVITSLVVSGVCLFAKQPLAKRLWDYALLNLVVVRTATRSLVTGRMLRLLGTMLQSGVPLLDSIRLCRSASRSPLFRGLFEAVEHDMLRGQAISPAFHAAAFLPGGVAQLIGTAEQNGKLGPVLQTAGEYYEEEGEARVRDLVKILEPALIVGLGVVVAAVVLAVMIPLFDASTIVH
jgi:type II secretory pathway component PulF